MSEVELDTLTGDARIIRADILMDVGHSVNPVENGPLHLHAPARPLA